MSLRSTHKFKRSYKKLPEDVQRKTDQMLALLDENPHHPSLRTHKRKGEEGVWQARLTRDYRIFFLMDGETLTLLDVVAHPK